MIRNSAKHSAFGRTLFSLAFLALLFAMAAGAIWHNDDIASGRPCAICQLGHMPIVDFGIPALTHPLAFVAPLATPGEFVIDLDPWLHQYPSRAPPA